ncbi:transketolase [Desulfuribacillus alkaliarsenatis]|uniref:Transketolase n=1 Tax=Desulfuribacillus alkaliarsenatis TaxID=766136 RepID=A0A1E5G1F6_9FIRM|nr:transketolase [Desulfuribacillus alkaliarsenatis]OEF96725.1 transketolase [Desulfuribacillus alkaliarsenatis]
MTEQNKQQFDNQQTYINAIRVLSAEAVEKANSGHPGMPMGMATAAYVLWMKHMRYNPNNPNWQNRDRFVLSAGHGSMLLYSLLYLTGYDVSVEDIKNFRQWDSKTPGHPEYRHTPGVETTTGPLGQGFANAVGMAMAEAHLAERFNKHGFQIVDHHTYVIASDGDLMEGISHEAASLAGHLKLGKLICLYDDNEISIEGHTHLAFTDDTKKRFEAYGWHVITVEDGNDVTAIDNAITQAKLENQAPSIIITKTNIGYGSPTKQNTASAHGEPLGEQELARTKEQLGWTETEPFKIPEEILSHYRVMKQGGNNREQSWNKELERYIQEYPALGQEWLHMQDNKLPTKWDCTIPKFPKTDKGIATRNASGKVLNEIAKKVPALIGGSADLAPSNKTIIESELDFSALNYEARNIRFGVREHGMGGILNGMALYGGLIPYGGTFLIFTDYMRPSIRLAALMGLKVIYVCTHDSIGLGEDGPTHQPIEHLLSLRAIPGLTVIRPADANETSRAWQWAVDAASGPVVLSLTRQNLPVLDEESYPNVADATKGAYILRKEQKQNPDAIIIGTGSETHFALEAASKLANHNIDARVVSMPSWEMFELQSEDYKQQVLPDNVTCRVSIEAGMTLGWERYTLNSQACIGINHFGASAPYKKLYEKFGITTEAVVEKVLQLR